ncbi:hypothetical protein KR093_011148 [Drosophila rubida]|uniref:Uncharacterized protein n=1 Tax=Drosophila rubida TaxID=30044 RepID=A0AAD4KHE7_9MUSC|nr:hypothetical protein KR093_011148 [Drosophila rubida]
MVCHKQENTPAPMAPTAPESEGCHKGKRWGHWSKMQQEHEHHHHHHHHVHYNGMVWDMKPQEKHGHCRWSKQSGPWFEHQRFAELQQKERFHEAPPKCFFRGMRQRNCSLPNYESHILFDYSENYN